MFKRVTIFVYGVACYALFFATFLYALGFVGNFFVPRAIDGEPRMVFASALGVNLALLGAFAVQHSLMARPFFKRWLTKFIPASAERSTYVAASSIALIALFYWWQPLGGVVWSVTDPVWVAVLYTLFARACDPVLGLLKSNAGHSDEQIVAMLLTICFDGLAGPTPRLALA